MKIGRQFVNYLFTCTIINNQNIYESTIAKPNKQKHKSQTATLVKQYNLTQNGKQDTGDSPVGMLLDI